MTDSYCSFPCEGKRPLIPWSQLGPGEQIPVMDNQNRGVATGHRSGIFVVDCDDDQATQWFVDTFDPPPTYTVQTRRGFHFYFRLPSFEVATTHGALRDKIDVLGEGAYVLGIPSEGKTVINDLPPAHAPVALQQHPALHRTARVSEPGAAAPTPVSDPAELALRTVKAGRYLSNQPACIEGQGGSAVLWRICLHLVRKLELPLDVCMALLQPYNQRCLPPWSEQELQHKLEDARDKSDMIPGTAPEGFMDDLRSALPKVEGIPSAAGGKLEKADLSTVTQVLNTHPDWENVFRVNLLTRQPIAVNPPFPMRMEQGSFEDGDVTGIRLWFAEHGYAATKEDVRDAVAAICMQPARAFNPVVDYLDALPPPGEGVPMEIFRIHETILNSPDGPVASSIFAKQMVAAVRRVRAIPRLHEQLQPVDHRVVVVMDGPQAAGKSSLLRLLGGPWYASLKGDVHDSETRLNLQGAWIVEMEEMVSARKADRDALKAFISAPTDRDRAKYARSAETIQRSYVLFGTSNETVFDDPTGAARFALIHVTKMNQEAAERLRDQLWSEANQLAQSNWSHYLDEEEILFCRIKAADADREDTVGAKLLAGLVGIPFVTLHEAYDLVLQTKADPVPSKADEQRFAEALRRIGCTRKRIDGVQGWLVPRALAAKPKHPQLSQWIKHLAASEVRAKLLAS